MDPNTLPTRIQFTTKTRRTLGLVLVTWKSGLIGQVCGRSVRKREAERYIRLEPGRLVVLTVGLIAPSADGFGGGGGQEGVSAEGADVGDGTVWGYLDFQDYVAGAVSG